MPIIPTCPICHLRFEPRDDSRVPYALPCGHVCCIGCLSHQPTSCPLCGTTCGALSCVRNLRPTPPYFRGGSVGPSDTDTSRQLLESISQVDEHTPLISLHRLYETANGFLETQPRNRCKELEVNVKLLRTLVLTKEVLVAQSHFVDDLAERIERIGLENVDFQSRLDEAEYRGSDKFNHSQFDSLMDYMACFRAELNDLQATVQALQNEQISTSAVSPIPSLSSGSLSPLQTPLYARSTSPVHDLDDDRLFIPPLPDIAFRGDDETSLNSVPQTPIIHPIGLPEQSHRSIKFDECHGHGIEKGSFYDQNLVERKSKTHVASPYEMPPRTKNEAVGSEGVLSPLSCISSLHLYPEPSSVAERPGDGLNIYSNKLDYSISDVQPQVNTGSEVAGSDIDEEWNDDDGDYVDPMSLSTSSLSLLKTPEHLPGPNAAYLQMRLHELLRDGVGSLVRDNVASKESQGYSGGEDLSRTAVRGLALNIAEGAFGAMATPATMPTSCAAKGSFTTQTDTTTASVPTNLMVSENWSTPSAVSNLTFRHSRPPSGALPPPPGPVSNNRSRISTFVLNQVLDELARSGSMTTRFLEGVTIDPGALAQHFLHEMEGCLIEAVARVFMQLLARVRGGAGGLVNQ